MIATTNAIAKIAAIAAGLGLVAMSFASFAPAAKAATIDDQIAALMAQIAALQGSSASAGASMTFTMDLTLGSTGAEVTALQNWLISKGYSIAAGATGYFGAQTQAALAKWQAANGVTPAAGYFGPITRAKVNAMGGSTGSTGGTTGGTSTGGLAGEEASLGTVSGNSGDDTEVNEGGTADIAEFEFDVDDGDVSVSRVDLEFETTASGSEETKPWKTFDTVTLLDEDGNEIASEDVSDKDDWLEDTTPYTFRFSGMKYVVRDGDQAHITVQVEANSSVDSADTTIPWTVDVATDGIRGMDGGGFDQYTGETNDAEAFNVVDETQGEELEVKTSTDDLDPTTIAVKDDTTSAWYTVFVFDLEATDSDIELVTLPVDFTVSSGETVSAVISDAKLVIDGEEFTDFDFTSAADTFGSTTFDINNDFTVADGDRIPVEVMVKFAAANGTNYDEGDTIQASVSGPQIEGETSDDITATGTATGETHTLAVNGVTAEFVSSDTSVNTDATPDAGTFSVTIKLTAFGDDIYVSGSSTAEDTSLTSVAINTGFNYDLTGTSTTASTDSTITSSADAGTLNAATYYTINEGESETFTLTVVGSSNTSIFSALKLGAIQYGTATSNIFAQTLYLKENDYKSDTENLRN